MNTIRCLTHATAVTALVAATVLLHTTPAQAATTTIIQLPRVVVTGQVVRVLPVNVRVVQLPRVVITGQRADRASTELVQAAPEKQPSGLKQGA